MRWCHCTECDEQGINLAISWKYMDFYDPKPFRQQIFYTWLILWSVLPCAAVFQSWNFHIFPEVQNCPSLWELRCNSFLQVQVQFSWFDIVTWFGVQKPQSQFCTSFLIWIAVNYFSSRKLRCDMQKFQVCLPFSCIIAFTVFACMRDVCTITK